MKDLFTLKDKVVILTGGSGFLGQQYTKVLEDFGAKVINWDLDTGIDVTKPDLLKKAAEAVHKEHGRIDALINNAALNPAADGASASDIWAPYEKFSSQLWQKELHVNLTGQHYTTQAVAPYMIKQKSGSIIFIASDLALIAPKNELYERGKFKNIAYVTSKAGVLGLMRSWAVYLGPHNVRANALAPGGMYRNHSEEFVKKNSTLNMLGRMAKAGDFNGSVIFLISNASTYMTGQCLIVDGGRTAW